MCVLIYLRYQKWKYLFWMEIQLIFMLWKEIVLPHDGLSITLLWNIWHYILHLPADDRRVLPYV